MWWKYHRKANYFESKIIKEAPLGAHRLSINIYALCISRILYQILKDKLQTKGNGLELPTWRQLQDRGWHSFNTPLVYKASIPEKVAQVLRLHSQCLKARYLVTNLESARLCAESLVYTTMASLCMLAEAFTPGSSRRTRASENKTLKYHKATTWS